MSQPKVSLPNYERGMSDEKGLLVLPLSVCNLMGSWRRSVSGCGGLGSPTGPKLDVEGIGVVIGTRGVSSSLSVTSIGFLGAWVVTGITTRSVSVCGWDGRPPRTLDPPPPTRVGFHVFLWSGVFPPFWSQGGRCWLVLTTTWAFDVEHA